MMSSAKLVGSERASSPAAAPTVRAYGKILAVLLKKKASAAVCALRVWLRPGQMVRR